MSSFIGNLGYVAAATKPIAFGIASKVGTNTKSLVTGTRDKVYGLFGAARYVGSGACNQAIQAKNWAQAHPKKAVAAGLATAAVGGGLILSGAASAGLSVLGDVAIGTVNFGAGVIGGTLSVAGSVIEETAIFAYNYPAAAMGGIGIPFAVAVGFQGGKVATEEAESIRQQTARTTFKTRMNTLFTPYLVVGPNGRELPGHEDNQAINITPQGHAILEKRHFPRDNAAITFEHGRNTYYGLRARNENGDIRYVSIQFIEDKKIAVFVNGQQGIPHQITQDQLNQLTLNQIVNLGASRPDEFVIRPHTNNTDFQETMELMLQAERDAAQRRIYPSLAAPAPAAALPVAPAPVAPAPGAPAPAPAAPVAVHVPAAQAQIMVPPVVVGNGYITFTEDNFPADKSVIVFNQGDTKTYGLRVQNNKNKVKFLAVQVGLNGLIAVVSNTTRPVSSLPPQITQPQLQAIQRGANPLNVIANLGKKQVTANYRLMSRHETVQHEKDLKAAERDRVLAAANQKLGQIRAANNGLGRGGLNANLLGDIILAQVLA